MAEKIVKEQTDSIKVARNAEGDVSWEIKIYYDIDTESEIDVINKIKCIDNMLHKEFKE